MKRRVLVVATACCALTFGVHAQTPLPPPTVAATVTNQPVTPSLTATSATSETPSSTEVLTPRVTSELLQIEVLADVLFPTGIAFQISFGEPAAELNSITMTVEQQGWEGQTIEIDVTDVTAVDGERSAVNYLWMVDENPPRLFEPLTITWSISSRSGVDDTVELELVFADSRVIWAVVENDDIPVRLAVSGSRTTAVAAQAQLTLLAELMDAGRRQVSPLSIVVFPAGVGSDPCDGSEVLTGSQTTIEAPCDFKTAEAMYAEQGWELAAVENASGMRAVIAEKIARAAYPSLFTREDVPRWLKVGLIEYLGGTFNINELESARSASRNNSLLPSLDIEPTSAEADRWRFQSIGMVVYMASRIGVVPMLELLAQLDDGESMNDVWLEETGQSINTLNTSWRNWIFSPYAESAFSLPPSLAPTPTFVPTRTATFTPTPTSTLTPSSTWTNTPIPSITPTPTPSVASGFQQPTAAPTSTPTATLQPTITPRPPVAFALDDTADAPASPLDRSLVIAAVAAVLVILLSSVFLFFTRRSK